MKRKKRVEMDEWDSVKSWSCGTSRREWSKQIGGSEFVRIRHSTFLLCLCPLPLCHFALCPWPPQPLPMRFYQKMTVGFPSFADWVKFNNCPLQLWTFFLSFLFIYIYIYIFYRILFYIFLCWIPVFSFEITI